MKLHYLKQQRLAKGLTILEVTKGLGYSTANGYWKIETGAVRLLLDHFLKLAEMFGIDPAIAIREVI